MTARGHPFRCPPLAFTPWPRLNAWVTAGVDRLLGLRALDDFYRSLPEEEGLAFIDAFVAGLGVAYGAAGGAAQLPATGPLLLVANHPVGILDGMVILLLLRRIRPDARVIVGTWLRRLPELAPVVFPMASSDRQKLHGFRQAIRWLRGGGALIAFPSGAVSRFDPAVRRVRDLPWESYPAVLIRHSGCDVVPVHVSGRCGLPFHAVWYLWPRLGSLLILRELMGQRGRRIAVRFGEPIPAARLAAMEERSLIDYLRTETERLGETAHVADRE